MSILLQSRKIFVPLSLQTDTVRLVQLVEHQIVVLGVVGSSPTSHPKLGRERFFESFSFCFPPMRRAALFALASFFLAVVAFAAGNALLIFAVCGIRCRQCSSPFCRLWHSLQAFLIFGFVAFGTGEGLLWYGICVPCSKRPPGVRDAFSEAFGVKNRLLRYGRDIRCAEQPSVVRGASGIFGIRNHHRNNTKKGQILRLVLF